MSVEDAAHAIGTTYTVVLPDGLRSRRGVFYTPPPLVSYLIHRAEQAGIDWEEDRILDPAAGGGAFLLPLLRRMVATHKGSMPSLALNRIQNRLVGFEIDEFAAWMSHVFVDVVIHEELGVSDPTLQIVETCNSLDRLGDGQFDLVIGNPPYGRVRLTATERQSFSRSLFGHANLYSLFLDLGVSLTSPDGIVAYVTPTSFLSGEYFKRLRELLTREAPPLELHLFNRRSGIFDDVLQETLLALFKRGKSLRRSVDVRMIELDDNDVVRSMSSAKFKIPSHSGSAWMVPRSQDAMTLVKRLETMSNRLSDWGYTVKTGPLVWNRHKERLRKKPSSQTVPLIWAEAVLPDGTFQFRAQKRNHDPYFEPRSENDPALVRTPCVLLQRTTSKEQSRRLIAAELPEQMIREHEAVAVENHLNMLVPTVENPPVATNILTAFLNSEIADRVFRCISGSVAVSAYELESMPLPAADLLNAINPADYSSLYLDS